MITRCVVVILAAVSTGSAAEPWEVCQFAAMNRPPPFQLFCWGSDGQQLYGLFSYAAHRFPGDPPPATLHGRRNGTSFRPNAVLQVSDSWEGPWRTVARVHSGKDGFAVDRQKGVSYLRVRLDAFMRHMRGTHCGRVVLESGEAATVDLRKLLRDRSRQ